MRFFRFYLASILLFFTFISCSEFLSTGGLIATPYNGQTVKGIQTIVISPADDVLVDSIYLYINFQLEKTLTTAPYQYEWDTSSISNGWCTISVELYDQLGGYPITDAIQVKVDN
ncbi:MAG: Ig-like domain-containing protein [Brevinematales bacterium]|nr:Ig-like domain-containing protein [Brevinematales bacterium]